MDEDGYLGAETLVQLASWTLPLQELCGATWLAFCQASWLQRPLVLHFPKVQG